MANNRIFQIKSDDSTLQLFLNINNKIAISIEYDDTDILDRYEVIQFDKDDCIALIDELTSLIKEI